MQISTLEASLSSSSQASSSQASSSQASSSQASSSQANRTLDTLALGEHGTVAAIDSANTLLRNKLLTMGIVGQTTLKVTNVAPLGDPITVSVRGFRLSLRRSEAKSIILSAE